MKPIPDLAASARLREQAETSMAGAAAPPSPPTVALSRTAKKLLLHDLQVHQVKRATHTFATTPPRPTEADETSVSFPLDNLVLRRASPRGACAALRAIAKPMQSLTPTPAVAACAHELATQPVFLARGPAGAKPPQRNLGKYGGAACG